MMPRIALSICGRSICPRGVLKNVLGRDLICSGILFPRRNMDKSWVKLLQLCINRSYDYQKSVINFFHVDDELYTPPEYISALMTQDTPE